MILTLWLGCLGCCAALCRSEAVTRLGYSQEIGDCSTMELTSFGYSSRHKYLCLETVVQQVDVFRKCPPKVLYDLTDPFGVPGTPPQWTKLCGNRTGAVHHVWL